MKPYVVFNPDSVAPIIRPRQAALIVAVLPSEVVNERLRSLRVAEHVRHEVLVAWSTLESAARLAQHGGDVEAAMTRPVVEDPVAESATMTTSAAGERLCLSARRIGQLLDSGELVEAEGSTQRRRMVTRASVEALRDTRQTRTQKKELPGRQEEAA